MSLSLRACGKGKPETSYSGLPVVCHMLLALGYTLLLSYFGLYTLHCSMHSSGSFHCLSPFITQSR